MGTLAADLFANITVTGAAQAQAQLERFSAALESTGEAGDAASLGIDRVGTSADAAATGLDAAATAGDATAASMDRVAASADAGAVGLDRVGASGDAAGAGAAGAGAGATAGAVGLLAFAGAGLLATKHMFDASTQFNTYMQDIISINPVLQASVDLQKQVAQAILDTSTATGMGATDVARAYYYIESAGLAGAQAQLAMNEAAKLGVIGMTNSTEAAQLLTAGINAYNLSISQTPQLMDWFTAGISHGVLRLADIQGVLPNLMATGAPMGIDIPQILGTVDELTNRGMTGRYAGFLTQSILTSFQKPNKELQGLINSMGYDSGQSLVEALGFPGAMQAIYNQVGPQNQTELNKLFSNSRAARGLNSLFGVDQGAGLNQTIGGIQNSQGEADKALAEQEKATSFHIGVMKAAFNDLAIAMGNGIRPIVQTVADAFAKLFETLTKIPAPILGIAGAALAVVSGFTFLVAGGELLAELFGGALGTGLEAVASSLGAMLVPLAAVAAGVYLLYEAFTHNFLGIKDDITNAINAISSAAYIGQQMFQFYAELGFNPVSAALEGFSYALRSLGADGIAAFVDQAARGFDALWQGATKLWDGLGKVFDGGVRFSSILKQLPDWMRPVALGLIEIVSGLGKLVNGFTDHGLAGVMAAWPDAWRQISHGIQFAIDALAGWVGELAGWTLDVAVPKVTGWLKDLATDAWGALKTAAGIAKDLGGALGSWVLHTLAPTVLGWLSILGNDAWTALKVAARFVGDVAADLGGWVLHTVAPTVLGWLSILGSDTWNALKAAARFFGDLAVDLGDWSMHTVAPTVLGWLSILADDTWAALKVAAGIVTNLAVDVYDWAMTLHVPDLGTLKDDFVTWVQTELKGKNVELSDWKLTLDKPHLTLKFGLGDLFHDAWDALTRISTPGGLDTGTPQQADAANQFGQKIGAKLVDGVLFGIREIFKSIGGSGGPSSSAPAAHPLAELLIGLVEGMWGAVGPLADQIIADGEIKVNQIADRFARWFEGIPGRIWGSLSSTFSTNRQGTGRPGPDLIDAVIALWNWDPGSINERITGKLDQWWGDVSSAISGWWNGLAGKISAIVGGGTPGAATGAGFALPGAGGGSVWDSLVKALTPDFSGIHMPTLPNWVTDPSSWLSPFESLANKLNSVGHDLQNAYDFVSGLLGKISSLGGSTNPNPNSGAPGSIGPSGTLGNNGGVTPVPSNGLPPEGPIAIPNSLFGGAASFASSVLSNFFGGGDLSRNGIEPIKIPAPDFSAVANALASITNHAKTSGSDFQRNLTTALKTTQTEAAAIFAQIEALAAAFASRLKQTATLAGNDILAALRTALNTTESTARSLFDRMVSDAQTFARELQTAARTAATNLQTALGDGLSLARGIVQTGLNGIIAILSSGADQAYWAGKQIGLGFANGLASMQAAVADAALALSNAASTTVTTRNQIASPSGLWRWFGQQNGLGYALGHTDMIPVVASSVGAMIAAPSLAAPSAAFAGGHSGGTVTITNHFTISGVGDPKAVGDAVVNAVSLAFGKARTQQVGLVGVPG